MASLRIVALSDTHGLHRHIQVPPGDVLVHAGDLTRHGDFAELVDLNAWLGELPHRHKLLVAGNHDWCFEQDAEACAALLPNAVYLQDAAVTLEGVTFYGSPWTPRFFDWAFMLPRGAPLRQRWDQIPAATQVLITHGPPYGQGDLTFRGERAGCEELATAVRRLRPQLHIFGHIHEGAGMSTDGATHYLNASIVDLSYRPVQPPLVIDLPLAS
jgi:Icc-related predicted phosphoesterase